MTATAEQAMEDMQDEVETQARLLENVTSRNVATLSWIGEVVGRQADTLPDALSSEMAKVSLERIEAFVCLEHTLRYRDDRVLADLRSFTDECSAMLLSRRSHGRTITLINEVSDTLIDAAHAARLATVIYELLANALDHAFVGREYGNFLRVALELAPEPHAEVITATVTAEDNGVGLPEGISLEEYETSGFSLIREVTAHYGGRVSQRTTGGGSSLRVELPLPEDAVA
jgi:two-component sensor histidine kinase